MPSTRVATSRLEPIRRGLSPTGPCPPRIAVRASRAKRLPPSAGKRAATTTKRLDSSSSASATTIARRERGLLVTPSPKRAALTSMPMSRGIPRILLILMDSSPEGRKQLRQAISQMAIGEDIDRASRMGSLTKQTTSTGE